MWKAIIFAAALGGCVSNAPPVPSGAPLSQQPTASEVVAETYGTTPLTAEHVQSLRTYLGAEADAFPGCEPETLAAGYRVAPGDALPDLCPDVYSPTLLGCHRGDGLAGAVAVTPLIEPGTPQHAAIMLHELLHAWAACTTGDSDPAHKSAHFCAQAERDSLWSAPFACNP